TFLEGTVTEAAEDDRVHVKLDSGLELWATASVPEARQGRVSLCLRPESVEILEDRTSGANIADGTILSETYLGDHIEYAVDVGGNSIKSRSQSDFRIGQSVSVRMPPDTVVCLPAGRTV